MFRPIIYTMVLMVSFPFLNCGKKCTDYSRLSLPPETDKFFAPYKMDNWWLYKNQSGTKTDSLYITSFIDTFYKDKTSCSSFELRKFVLHNKFLLELQQSLFVTYQANFKSSEINFSLSGGLLSGAPFPQFIYNKDEHMLRSFPETDNPGSNKLDSIRLNNAWYYDILKGNWSNNTYYFSKNIGLVGWVIGVDTFGLISYRIK